MRLTPPKKWVFYTSAVIAVIGLLSTFVAIPVLSDFSIFVVFIGWLLLAAGNALKGF